MLKICNKKLLINLLSSVSLTFWGTKLYSNLQSEQNLLIAETYQHAEGIVTFGLLLKPQTRFIRMVTLVSLSRTWPWQHFFLLGRLHELLNLSTPRVQICNFRLPDHQIIGSFTPVSTLLIDTRLTSLKCI